MKVSAVTQQNSASEAHHALWDSDNSEVQDMQAIRSLLFGKQNAQITKSINELEKRFENVAKDHTSRITTLEKDVAAEIESRIDELSEKLTKLEEQLLNGAKEFKAELTQSNRDSEVLLFNQIRQISEATIKDLDKFRKEIRREIEELRQSEEKNFKLGQVLVNLGNQLQSDSEAVTLEAKDEYRAT